MRSPMRAMSLLFLLAVVVSLLPLFSSAAGPYYLRDGVRQDIISAVNESVSASYSVATSPYELRVTLTVFSGNPDVFVSTSPNPQVNNYTWRSFDAGHTALIIRSSDLRACRLCTYYITVRDYFNPSSSHLLVTSRGNASWITTPLSSPYPTTGILDPSIPYSSAVYAFNSSMANNATTALDLRFVLTPIQGDAELVVSTDITWLFSLLPRIRAGQLTAPILPSAGGAIAWQTTGHGMNGLVLRLSNQQFPPSCRTYSPTTTCTFWGLVYTRLNATVEYVLQAGYVYPTVDPVPHALVNHVPLLRVLQAGQAEYHTISTLPGTVTPLHLSISLTHVVGQTTLLVSRNRCSGPVEWSSSGLYAHSSVYNSGLPPTPLPGNTTWCVQVRALTNTTYSLTGSLTLTSFPDRSPIRLINGLPYNDALRDNRLRWYVHYQPFNDSITLSASRKFGDLNAYFCTQSWTVPTPVVLARDCRLLSNVVGLGSVTDYLPAGRYLLGIQAARGYSYDVDYTLTLTGGFIGSRLQTAVPLPVIIDQNGPWMRQGIFNVSFHEFYWPFDGRVDQRNLTVTCSMYSGHVTLYGSAYGWPSRSNYTWASDRVRMDAISIPWWQLSPGYYFFTVEADSPSTFTLTASTYGNVQLQPGLPNNAFISRGEVHYYWLTLPQYLTTNVSVNLVPLRGFASLLISNNSIDPAGPDSPLYPTPGNPQTYSLAANNPFTSTQIAFIPHLDWCRGAVGSADNPPRCRYVIAVVGEEDTRYQLTVVTPASTQVLQASVPQPGFLGAVYRPGMPYEERRLRYQFYVPSDRCNVTLSLTALWDEDEYNTTGGQPLRLSLSRSPFNISATLNDVWRLPRASYRPQQATLYFDWRYPSALMQGWYYAEVEGSFGAVFTLALTLNDATLAAQQGWRAQVSNASALIVLDGQPQRHSLGVNAWDMGALERPALFQYDVPISRHLSFLQLNAEVIEGDAVEIFARNDGQVPTRNPSEPNQWWSGAASAINDILIPPPREGSKGYCDQPAGLCTYIVAVYRSRCCGNYSTFQFSVVDDGQRDELLNSVPLDGIVLEAGPGAWRYFNFRVAPTPDNRSVTLDVTLNAGDGYSGSPQLFADLDALPTSNSTRGSMFDGRNSKLRLNGARPGVWVIGVLNDDYVPRTVSLVATSDDSLLLLDSVPLYYALSAGQTDVTFRCSFLSVDGSPFLFQLSPALGNPALNYFANFDGTRPQRQASGQWIAQLNSSSLTAGPFRNSIYVPQSSPLWRNATTVYVTIEQQSTAQVTPFTALATATSLTQLEDGEASQERFLGPGERLYFNFRTTLQPVTFNYVDVGLSKTTGLPGAYLVALFSGANGVLPTNTSYARRLDVPRDVQSNSSTLELVGDAEYKVAVLNVGTEYTGFTLVAASAYSVTVIPDARPVSAQCESRPKLFSTLVSGEQSDVVIYIRPSRFADFVYSAGVRVLVGTSPYNVSDVQWTFAPVYWNQTITIRRRDEALQRCLAREVCELLVSIDCVTSSTSVQYTVTTQVGLELIAVQPYDYLPVVSTGYPKFYQVFVPNIPALYIQVTPCYGDVSLYLSDRIDRYPSPSSYSLLFTTPNSLPSITVGPGYIRNQTEYYLGVYPYNNTGAPAEFTLQVLPFNPETPGTAELSLTHSSATLAVNGNSVRWQPPTVSPQWSNQSYVLRYSIFISEDRSGDANRVLYTHCGLARAGHLVEVDLSTDLKRGGDGFYERPVGKLDSRQRYSVNLIAELFNTTGGSMQRRAEVVYSPATIQATSADDPPSQQSTVIAEVIAAIFLPAFILAALVALYLRRRTQQLEEELSVELPDVEQSIDSAATPADSASRRQRRRERVAEGAGNGLTPSRNGRGANDTARASLLANDHLGQSTLG